MPTEITRPLFASHVFNWAQVDAAVAQVKISHKETQLNIDESATDLLLRRCYLGRQGSCQIGLQILRL